MRTNLQLANRSESRNLPNLFCQIQLANQQGYTQTFEMEKNGQLQNLQTGRICTQGIYMIIVVICNGGRLFKIVLEGGERGIIVAWQSKTKNQSI